MDRPVKRTAATMSETERLRKPHGAVLALGWLTTLGMAGFAAARWLAHDAMLLLVWANSFTLYLYLPAYPIALLALWRRCRALAAVAGLVAGCHLFWVLAGVVPSPGPNASAPNMVHLRVFSANIHVSNPRPEEIIAEIARAEADILVLQEVSPRWWSELRAAGLLERFPYHSKVLRGGAFGSAILSRWPLEEVDVVGDERSPMIRCTVLLGGDADVLGGAPRLRLYNVHPLPPSSTDYMTAWNRQHEQLADMLAEEAGPVLAIGDFNATQHSYWLARHTRGRMRSAHEDRGRPLAVSWPNGQRLLPPIRIDHALLSPEIGCLDVREGEGFGSDHKPLVVDLLVPK